MPIGEAVSQSVINKTAKMKGENIMTKKEFAVALKKVSEEDIRSLIDICQNELDSRAKKSKKTVASTPATPVVKKQEAHYLIKGMDLWILYKDPKESGSYQFNRVSKAIKLSATKDFGARFTGDYNQKIWKWTFQTKEALKGFQKAQKERA